MKSNKTVAKHTKRTNIRKIGKFSNPYVNEIGIHHFDDGTEALIFDVGNPNALNQIIGYAKFINADYGNVYYRGETELHSSVLPSIAREAGHQKYEESLNRVIAAAIADEQFTNCAKLSNLSNSKASKLSAEAMLQHYGFSTHFVDVVDNHWIALWFGLNQHATITNLSTYSFYKQRRITPVELYRHKEKVIFINICFLLLSTILWFHLSEGYIKEMTPQRSTCAHHFRLFSFVHMPSMDW